MLYKVCKFIFADMEQEERWLNEMAQQGLNFQDNIFVRYTFTQGQPNEYIYRIELLEHPPRHPLSQKYIAFLDETGVECVSTAGRWAYFRKKQADGPFDLFSDLETRISHYRRNRTYVAVILMFNLIILTMNLLIALSKGLPGNYFAGAGTLVFGILLIRSMLHYTRRIRALKDEKKIHE